MTTGELHSSRDDDNIIIIGASLSETHIDHDYGPRRKEIYVCMWHACSVSRPNVPKNAPIQSITCSARSIT